MSMNKNVKTSITLVDELMVDITGSLIPGFLFLVILFVCVCLPLAIFSDFSLTILLKSKIPGGFFWVLLVIILILAYVIGHVYYRADIKDPDKTDIDREIKEIISNVKKTYSDNNDMFRSIIESKLHGAIITLNETCMNVEQFRPWYVNRNCSPAQYATLPSHNVTDNIYWCFCKSCNQAVELIAKKEKIPRSLLLGILFPEEVYRVERKEHPDSPFDSNNVSLGVAFSQLQNDIQKIWEEEYRDRLYKTHEIGVEAIVRDESLWLAVCWCILEAQTEIGCISINECSFPYTYYYKYLLKRNIIQLIDEVKWNSRDSRSKNVINEYKTQMQLFVPEKYAIVNKNESHVRMSSSTWHMARVSIWIALGMTIFSIILTPLASIKGNEWGLSISLYHAILAIALPLSVIWFCWFARKRITNFIHYQRNREIFHALCAYDQCRDIITHRRHLQSTSRANR